ncbi:MAG: hypothetical protein ABIG93_04220, partial [archaeon]
MENNLEIQEPEKFVPQKVRTARKVWSSIAIFMICLVISLPIYSANVMATSLSVTENHGTNQYEGYLDAEGDTWNLIASITNYNEDGDISPDQVVLDVSGSQIEFSSCSGDSLETTCEFQSVLGDGISEGTYPFKVILYDLVEDPNNENVTEFGSELASDTDSITADGSEPSITFANIYQEEGEIYLDFTVTDQPSGLCAGIAEVEIIDSDTGSILETIALDEDDWLGVCEFDYIDDGDTAGVLSAGLTGEGTRHFKIRATDFLGHTKTSSAKSFDTDFVAPSVKSGSLALLDFGDYVGTYTQITDVAVNITECTGLEKVVATSDYMEFYSQAADCNEVDDDNCIWECIWNDISVNPSGSSVSIDVAAQDEAGNVGSGSVTTTFTSDSAGPSVEFFGTEFLYNENSYLSASGQNKIYLRVSESGSGIDEDSVAANLASVGGQDWDTPDECYEEGSSGYECYWTVSNPGNDGSTSTKEINIRFLEDKVGNEGDLLAQEIIVDGVAPKVKEIELYGFSAIGEKSYFQSNDDLIAKVKVQETSGLVVYIDANDIVMDAENKYQYGSIDNEGGEYVVSSLDGWIEFTEESCSRNEESLWDCEFRIDSIKSGYDGSANLEVLVMDTAGNEAEWDEIENDVDNADGSKGDYSIEIFALDEETQPDFWETGSVNTDSFIDLEIAELTSPRINYQVKLRSSVSAQAALIEVRECTGPDDGPPVSRAILFGGIDAGHSPSLNLILEFEPFDPNSIVDFTTYEGDVFSSSTIQYNCSVNIYSVVDDTAMNYAELQSISVPVEFAYSELGALDENIDDLIYQEVSKSSFQVLDKLKWVNKILEWAKLLVTLFQVIKFIWDTVGFIQEAADEARKTPQTEPLAITTCFGTEAGKSSTNEIFNKIGNFLSIFYCNPSDVSNAKPGLSGYAQWQSAVMEVWSFLKGEYLYELIFTGGVAPPPSVGGTGTNTGDPTFRSTEQSKQFWYNQVSNRATGSSLYDNIYVSAIGLCIPGVFYNLEKLRQAHCTKLACLKNDVPAGLATVDTCFKLQDYLICKYLLGEVVAQILPMDDIGNLIFDLVRSIIADPIGTAMSIITIICSVICSGSGKGVKVCSFINWLTQAVGIVNQVASVIKNIPAIGYDVCKQSGVETVLKNYEQENTDGSVTTEDIGG